MADRLTDTDTDTLPYFHTLTQTHTGKLTEDRLHRFSSRPQEKLAGDDTTLSFLLLLVVIFISQLHGNKHQPPVFFCPHPCFLTPSNFPFHPPPPSSLGDSPLYTTPKHTPSTLPPAP